MICDAKTTTLFVNRHNQNNIKYIINYKYLVLETDCFQVLSSAPRKTTDSTPFNCAVRYTYIIYNNIYTTCGFMSGLS